MLNKRYVKDSVAAYVFLLPVIVGIALFTLYPIVMSLFYSFTDFQGAYATRITIENYAALFTGVERNDFWVSMGRTVLYVVCTTVLNLVLSYALALFLKKNIKGMRVIRLLCYVPVLIPAIASGLIWRDAFSYNSLGIVNDYGIFNTWLHKLGLGPLTFFESAKTAMPTLIFTNLWGLGGGMIMWLAALGNVPDDLYESAELDGAGYFRKVFSITIPLTTSMLFYNLVTQLIAGLQIFNTYATYGTGEGDSLYFVAIRIYTKAFPGISGIQQMGMACAMSWILFIVIGLLTVLLFKTNNWVKYNDD